MSHLQRKYIDLIYQGSTKWVSCDPPTPIQVRLLSQLFQRVPQRLTLEIIDHQVGAYGTVDRKTGDLIVEGNIYDPEFQRELDKRGINICLKDSPPLEGAAEDTFAITSRGYKQEELNADSDVERCAAVFFPSQYGQVTKHIYKRVIHWHANRYFPGTLTAPIEVQLSFKPGERGAILAMYNPRQVYLPPNIALRQLYRVSKLRGRYLVTSVYQCSTYAMYLSDMCTYRHYS